MDWFKVKIKHAEYDFADAPDNAFRAWIMLMSFVAASERKPKEEQLRARLGSDNYDALESHASRNGYSLQRIIKKVMEDVQEVKRKRVTAKDRQAQYRREHLHDNEPSHTPRHALCHTSRNALVTGQDKIREDKIREDKKKLTKPHLNFEYLDKKNMTNLLKLHGDKEGLREHLRQMGFYDVRITEAYEKAGIC